MKRAWSTFESITHELGPEHWDELVECAGLFITQDFANERLGEIDKLLEQMGDVKLRLELDNAISALVLDTIALATNAAAAFTMGVVRKLLTQGEKLCEISTLEQCADEAAQATGVSV